MAGLYRKSALDKLSSPEQLDEMITILHPSFWITSVSALAILLAALIWSVFSRVPVKLPAAGIYTTESGIHLVYSEENGIIEEVLVNDGDLVKAGDIIARLSDKSIKDQPDMTELKTDTGGYVLGINVMPGNTVTEGSVLCRIADESFSYSSVPGNGDGAKPIHTADAAAGQDDEDPMSVILYVPVSKGKSIREGMEVKVYPTTVNRQEYGHINAFVNKVGDYVASTEEMRNMLGDDSLVQSFMSAGPVIQIKCSLKRDESTVSGYEWSSKKGAKVELVPGTTVDADIVVEKKAPINMLLPMIKEKLAVEKSGLMESQNSR